MIVKNPPHGGFFCTLLLALLWLPTAWGQSLAPGDEERYGHLRYFGFYASAMAHWNFTAELAPHTNLTWIHVGSASDPGDAIDQMLFRLQQAKESGVEAVLSLEPFLFANDKGEPRPQTDVEAFLLTLRARIEAVGLLQTVAMIYPKDEPFREFVKARDPNFIEEFVTGEVYEDVHLDLWLTNHRIKSVFPEIPLGVILSGHRLHHDFFSIPDNYDWVGFDCYKDLYRSCDDKTFNRHYEQLLTQMHEQQRLIAVAETWVENDKLDRADWPGILHSRLLHHYEMALSDSRFVAFIPFIWSFEADGEVPGVGLDRFPELFDQPGLATGSDLVDAVLNIGWQIKNGMPVYPNLHHADTEDSPYRPPSEIRGEIVRLDESGELTAWALDDGLPYKNLRVQLYVRGPRGHLQYKSKIERTFLPSSSWKGLGAHVYRHRVPKSVLRQVPPAYLEAELRVFADGASRETALTLILPPQKSRDWIDF